MVNKLMRCSTSLVTREPEITPTRYHCTPPGMPRIPNQKMMRPDEGVEKVEPYCFAGRNVNWFDHHGKGFDAFSEKWNRVTVWSSNFTSGYINKRIWSRDSPWYTHVPLRLHRDFPMISSHRRRRLRRGLHVVSRDTLTAAKVDGHSTAAPLWGIPEGQRRRREPPSGQSFSQNTWRSEKRSGRVGESCPRSYLTSIDTSPDDTIFQGSMKHLPRQTTCWAFKQAQQVWKNWNHPERVLWL